MSTHDDGTGPMRQCGRCRRFFPRDGAVDPDATPKWWLCAPCHETLLGKGTLKQRTTLALTTEGALWSSLN
jgi:hypothetical protein